jgi:hypothetical protein
MRYSRGRPAFGQPLHPTSTGTTAWTHIDRSEPFLQPAVQSSYDAVAGTLLPDPVRRAAWLARVREPGIPHDLLTGTRPTRRPGRCASGPYQGRMAGSGHRAVPGVYPTARSGGRR